MKCVGLIDITVATRRASAHRNVPPRDAARRNTSLPACEPLGKPGGSRAFSADAPPQSPVAPKRLPQPAGG